MALKTYHAAYRYYGGWGAYDERDVVVFANTELEALGLALHENESTHSVHWTITELDTGKPYHYISERSS